jgi:hypothetical protein
MSAVFIISEVLIQLMNEAEDLRLKINEFVELRQKIYVEGNFKEFFRHSNQIYSELELRNP